MAPARTCGPAGLEISTEGIPGGILRDPTISRGGGARGGVGDAAGAGINQKTSREKAIFLIAEGT